MVKNEAQHKAEGDGWFESPAPAKAALEQLARSNPSPESLRLYGNHRLTDAVYKLRYKDATGAEQRRIIQEYLDSFLALALESAWAEKPISLIQQIESWQRSLPATDQQHQPASGGIVETISSTAPPGESFAESGAEKLAGLAEAQSDIAPEEKPLSPRLEKARRCHKIIEEVERIKFLFVGTGKSMSQIQAEHPEFEVWGLVQNLDEEYRNVFYRPRTWGPTVGYAKSLLSKGYNQSEHTITDWIKDYRRDLKSKNSPR